MPQNSGVRGVDAATWAGRADASAPRFRCPARRAASGDDRLRSVARSVDRSRVDEVRPHRVRVGQREIVATRSPCYDEATNVSRTPCAGLNTRLVADVSLDSLPEGVHELTAEARDPGGLTASRRQTLRIDRTAPAAPRELGLDGVAWRGVNRFGVTWAASPGGDVAPLVGNEYASCPATNAAYDAGGCVQVSSNFAEGATGDSVTVPGEGAWVVRAAHRDAAGNTNPANVSAVGPLRFDATPPSGEFEARSARSHAHQGAGERHRVRSRSRGGRSAA